MKERTKQMDAWAGDFGRSYTDRNPQSLEELNELYTAQFGISRSALNQELLGDVDRSARILEVGANVAVQLQALQAAGFRNLFGVELQHYALTQAKARTRGLQLVQASAFGLPFQDGDFDLVYTSGVLIHINPEDIGRALAEVHRCSRRYIWGFEYYADDYTSVPYHGREDLMWKTDFAGLYREHFAGLRLVREKKVKYTANQNVDAMFLLEKVGS